MKMPEFSGVQDVIINQNVSKENNTFGEIIRVMTNSKRVCIVAHKTPDPDAFGSCMALYIALKLLNKHVGIFLQRIPDALSYLIEGLTLNSEVCDFDLFISLDCADREIMFDEHGLFNKTGVTINIDHHETNKSYAKYNYVKSNAGAAGEVLYEILQMLLPISKQIAEFLYVAIAGDTGGLRHSNTTSNTLNVVSKLVEYGIDMSMINKKLFDYTTIPKLKVLAKSIESLEMFFYDKVAVMRITCDQISEIGIDVHEVHGIIKSATNIAGVEVGVYLKQETAEKIKVSFRSNEYVDVSVIAETFGGGGHKRASGCTMYESIENAKKMILSEIEKHI